MTAWLFLALVVVVPVVLALLSRRGSKPEADQSTYQAIVGLHAVRRRLEVAQFKTELRRDTAHLRRELRAELQQDTPRTNRPER